MSSLPGLPQARPLQQPQVVSQQSDQKLSSHTIPPTHPAAHTAGHPHPPHPHVHAATAAVAAPSVPSTMVGYPQIPEPTVQTLQRALNEFWRVEVNKTHEWQGHNENGEH